MKAMLMRLCTVATRSLGKTAHREPQAPRDADPRGRAPRKQWVIDLRLQERLERPSALPDLAVAGRDLRAGGEDVVVTLHNIGSAASGPFDVVLETAEGEGWREAARTHVASLPGITDLTAARRDATLRGAAVKPGCRYRVVVDPQGQVEESCEMNNAVTVRR